jgi:hypothetical protein
MKKVKDLVAYFKVGNNSADLVLGNLPFVFFLMLVGIAYIANAHHSEKMIRRIQAMEREIKDIRSRSISMKASLMVNRRLSEIEKDVAVFDLKMTNNPPLKVVEK